MSLTVHCTVIHLLLFFIDILDCYYQPVFSIIWTATNNQSSSSFGLLQTTSLLHHLDCLGCHKLPITYWAVTSAFGGPEVH